MKAAEFKNWMKSIEQMSSDQLRNHQEHELQMASPFSASACNPSI